MSKQEWGRVTQVKEWLSKVDLLALRCFGQLIFLEREKERKREREKERKREREKERKREREKERKREREKERKREREKLNIMMATNSARSTG